MMREDDDDDWDDDDDGEEDETFGRQLLKAVAIAGVTALFLNHVQCSS